MHLLIVDDDDVLRILYERQVRELGHEVTVCDDGDEACELIRTDCEFDAVWTDISMPGKDGFDVMRALRAHRPGTPVIVVSAYSDQKHIIRALRSGAANFLSKPFQNADLAETLKRLDDVVAARSLERGAWGSIKGCRVEFEVKATMASAAATGGLLRQYFRGLVGEGEAQGLHVAVNELLFNAVEHGCLGVSREAKIEALLDGSYRSMIAQREADPANARKSFTVSLEAEKRVFLRVEVEDEGPGFDPSMLPDPSEPENLHLPSGRGVFLARLHASELSFSNGGRRVKLAYYHAITGADSMRNMTPLPIEPGNAT